MPPDDNPFGQQAPAQAPAAGSLTDAIVQDAASQYRVDPSYIHALIGHESGGNPNATNTNENGTTDYGLMQINDRNFQNFGITDPFNKRQNVFAGTKYFREMLDKFGQNPAMALAAYNRGPDPSTWTDTQEQYVNDVMSRVDAFRRKYQPQPSQPAPPQPQSTQATQPTRPPAPTDSTPYVIGDSLGEGIRNQGRYQGMTTVGDNPRKVLDKIEYIEKNQPDLLRGRPVILSSGASNDPHQIDLVDKQIAKLRGLGVSDISLVGVGNRPDLARLNPMLEQTAQQHGAYFTGAVAGAVHPSAGYGAMTAQAPRPKAAAAAPAAPDDNPFGRQQAAPSDNPFGRQQAAIPGGDRPLTSAQAVATLPMAQTDEASRTGPVAPNDTGLWNAAVEGAKAPFRGIGATAGALVGARPGTVTPNIVAAQPIEWGDFLRPGVLAQKGVYGLLASSPAMAGFFGGSLFGGGPDNPVGLAFGAMGAALGHAASSLGETWGAELQATPNDPDGAFDRAMVKTGIGAAFTGAGFAAFGITPAALARTLGINSEAVQQALTGRLKQMMFQAAGIQPGVAIGEQAATNVAEGKPVGQDLLAGVPGAVVGTAAPALAHFGAERALDRIAAGRPAGTPPGAETPPAGPPGAPARTPEQAANEEAEAQAAAAEPAPTTPAGPTPPTPPPARPPAGPEKTLLDIAQGQPPEGAAPPGTPSPTATGTLFDPTRPPSTGTLPPPTRAPDLFNTPPREPTPTPLPTPTGEVPGTLPPEPPPPSGTFGAPDIAPTPEGGRRTPLQPVPPAPMRLNQWLIQKIVTGSGIHQRADPGGVQDSSGEILQIIGGDKKNRIGLINSKGRTLDAATQAAVEAGYLPEGTNDYRELLNAIDQDHNRAPVYSMHDAERADAHHQALDYNEEIKRAALVHGLPISGVTAATFHDMLREKMTTEQRADEMAQQEHDAIEIHRALSKGVGGQAKEAEVYGQSQARTLEDLEREYQQTPDATDVEQRAAGPGEPGVVGRAEGAGETPIRQDQVPSGDAGRGQAGAGEGPATELEARRREIAPGQGDIFGGPAAGRAPRAPEFTIGNDPRQEQMPGMGPSAQQAQAARDQAGRGALQPRVPQQAPGGMFEEPETIYPGLPLEQPAAPVEQAPQPTGHRLAADRVVAAGRVSGNEHMAFVDNATGQIIHEATDAVQTQIANVKSVEVPIEMLDKLPDDSVTLHHNHPPFEEFSGTVSLSMADLVMALHPALSHVVAVGHDGEFFSARATGQFADLARARPKALGMIQKAFEQAVANLERGVQRVLGKLVAAGHLTPDEATLGYDDMLNRILHAQGQIDYVSSQKMPPPIERALRQVLETAGHAASVHDRYTQSVLPDEGLARLPGADAQSAAATAPAGGRPGADQEGPGFDQIPKGQPPPVQGTLFARAPRGLGLGPPPYEVLRDKKGLDRWIGEIRAAFAPTSMRGAASTEQTVRPWSSRAQRAYDQSVHAVSAARFYVDKLPQAEQEEATYRAETGQRQKTPELQNAMDLLRGELDRWTRAIQGMGKGLLTNAIQNYMGHIWSDWSPEAARAAASKQPLEGGKAFLKQRYYATQREGIQVGKLTPVTYNPIDMQLIKLREMQKFYFGNHMYDELKAKGIARFVPAGNESAARDAGMVELNDRMFKPQLIGAANPAGWGRLSPGSYWAAEPAARIFNNYMSRGLAGESAVYDAFRRSGNFLNMMQLGLSMFHATFVTMDSMISTVALGVQQTLEGQLGRGLGNILLGTTPLAMAKAARQGGQFRTAWLDPQNADPRWARVANLMNQGGGQFTMPDFYRSNASGAFFKNWTDMQHPTSPFYAAWQMLGDAKTLPEKALLVPLQLAFRAVDTMNEPLMGAFVPRIKAGVFAAMAENWQRMNPNATPEERSAAMIKFSDSVDNRLGQMRYDNVFWNKTMKDIAFIMQRSVGWNLGTIRELAGGTLDGLRAVNDMAHLRRPEFTARMAYSMAMPAVVALWGSMLTYAATGQGPQQPMDAFFPLNGGTDEKGEPTRWSLPSYWKDVIEYTHAPVQTLLNKTHPLVQTLQELYHNQDYYGRPIATDLRDSSTAAQYADYAVNQLLPFSIRSYMKVGEAEGTTRADRLLSFFGIQAPPKSITQPELGERRQLREEKKGLRKREPPGMVHLFSD